jgi:hypothetical protein
VLKCLYASLSVEVELVHLLVCVPMAAVKAQDPNGVLELCKICLIIHEVYSDDSLD